MESILCWLATSGCGCPKVWLVFSDIPWEKTNFPFPSRYQLQIDSWLGVGPCVHYLLSVLGLIWLSAGILHAGTVSVASMCSIHFGSVRHCLFGVIHHLLLLNSFCFLLCIDL